KQLAALETQLREKTAEATSSIRRADDLASQLQDADARAKQLQTEIQAYRSKLTSAEAKTLFMAAETNTQEKELAEDGRNIDIHQREKKALADQANRALAAVENRFEGIRLTGKRVLFLVDMSGSMELVDERTPDANKWIGVRETLAKVMRSLTDLEK